MERREELEKRIQNLWNWLYFCELHSGDSETVCECVRQAEQQVRSIASEIGLDRPYVQH